MITARDLIHPEPTQLDRIEAQNLLILELLTKKKTVSKPRAAKEVYSADFNEVWEMYPKRAGANPKLRAAMAYDKRFSESGPSEVNEHETLNAMFFGTARYAKFCKSTGKTGTEYVMQAATFFGPERHYLETWKIPDTVKKSAIPRDNDEMLTWARKRGMREPHINESWSAYRAYVEGEA